MHNVGDEIVDCKFFKRMGAIIRGGTDTIRITGVEALKLFYRIVDRIAAGTFLIAAVTGGGLPLRIILLIWMQLWQDEGSRSEYRNF